MILQKALVSEGLFNRVLIFGRKMTEGPVGYARSFKETVAKGDRDST